MERLALRSFLNDAFIKSRSSAHANPPGAEPEPLPTATFHPLSSTEHGTEGWLALHAVCVFN